MPGDRIQISCDEDPDYCVVRTIGSDGRVSIPDLGDVGVATKSADSAADKISRLLVDSGLLVRATIHVSPVFSKGSPIVLRGAVHHMLELRFRDGVKLSEILKTADPAESADTTRIQISHPDGRQETIDASEADPRLEDGDRVFVPLSSGDDAVNVLGGVRNPCAVPYRKGMTLSSALDSAGGFDIVGDSKKIVLIRASEEIPLSMPEEKDFPLKRGETIKVSLRKNVKLVAVQGLVANQGLIELLPGMTLSQAAAQAGVDRTDKRSDSVWLISVLGTKHRIVKLSLRAIAAHRTADPVLRPDDVVSVGFKDPGTGR